MFGLSSAAPATGSLFGSTPAVTTSVTSGGLFGASSHPTTTSTGTSLFGFPTVTTAAAGGIFGSSATSTPSVSTTTATTVTSGLGGSITSSLGYTGITSTTATGIIGASGTSTLASPLDGELPKEILELVKLLRERIKKNRELADEFEMSRCSNDVRIGEKLGEIKKEHVIVANDLRTTKHKATGLLSECERDARMGEQLIRKHKEALRNPYYGQVQASEYLEKKCFEYKDNIDRKKAALKELEDKVSRRLHNSHKRKSVSLEDLRKALERFDKGFKAVAAGVFETNQQVEDAKESFLEYRRSLLPYAPNPFAKDSEKRSDGGISRIIGAEAFPSQTTMMKIGSLAKSGVPSQPNVAAPTFGSGGSLFGPKPLGSTPFSFSTPSASTGLFKPFGTPTTSAAAAPIFGGTTTTSSSAPPPAPTTSASFTFGNTFNSSVSGTLFGGSASKPFGK